MLRIVFFAALLPLLAQSASAAESIPGWGPVGAMVKLHGGLQFAEGPVPSANGGVYFTDIDANRIYHLDGDGKLSLFVEPSRHADGMAARIDQGVENG